MVSGNSLNYWLGGGHELWVEDGTIYRTYPLPSLPMEIERPCSELKNGIPPVDPVESAVRYTPKRIVRNGPATIVFWEDGTKTIVKRSPDEPDNAYAAFTAALGIKVFGSNSKLKRIIKDKTVEQK